MTTALTPKRRRESPLTPTLVVLALVLILVGVPRHYRLLPQYSEVVIGGAFVALLWTRFAPLAVAAFAVIVGTIQVTILGRLLYEMAVEPSHLDAIVLFWTAIDLWLTNVVLFTLIYWQVDRGGPEGRAGDWHGQVDFYFPRGDAIDSVPADWRPSFMDYFYLSFTTSTAFSPSEIYPLTDRAKAMHIAQSLISLLIIVALAARAIDVLGK